MRNLRRFLGGTDGLTTIEWVCICAVALLAALGISTTVLGGAKNLGTAVTGQMNDAADDID